MKKTLSLVLIFAMLFSLGLAIAPAAEEAPELKISYANLEFASSIHLWFAVDYSAFDSYDGVKLKVTNNVTGEVTTLSPVPSISSPEGCIAFKYTKLKYKNMGDELTLQAYKDGEASGAAKTYSTLEYALRAQGRNDDKLTELMLSMLALGKNAQKAFKHTGTYDLSKSLSLVALGSGATVNGKTKVIVPLGSELSATMAEADDAYVWYNGNNEDLGRGASLSFVADAPYIKISCSPSSDSEAGQ
ncbi:MAG: hypothetical protein IKC34_04690 [Clostridia bacterium]|nr:hypothetical protein [Clostridia bacterium]